MTAKLDHALALAGRGLRVFPIQPNGKKPIIKNWDTLATTQPETINRWWSEHEDANIGLATGQGVVVLDYDMKPGQKGQQALDMHDMLGLPLDGYNVTTPTGGLHLYFRSGKPIRNSASKVAKNVDVRGDGGYVVAPGSTIDGKTYEATLGELLDLPEWLAELATASKTVTKVDAKTPLVDLDKPSNIEAAQAWARDEAPEAIEGSGGDETTYKVAARLRDFGLSQAECFNQLAQWNEFKAIPPWALEELEQKVRNAYAYATLPIGINDAQGELGDVSSELSSLETKDAPKQSKLYWRGFEDGANRALQIAGEPLIKGLLTCGDLSAIYGASNSGKTFIKLDMAFHIASGIAWQGHKVKQGLVVYVATEGGTGIFKRLAALKIANKVKGDIPLAVVPCPINLLDKTREGDTRALVDLVAKVEEHYGQKAVLIVVDTLSRALAGGDENAGTDMGVFIRHIDRIRIATKAHVSLVHHSGKDQARGMRGWSGMRAAIDTEIEIHEGVIRVTKQRDMEPLKPFRFKLKPVVIGTDQDGDEVASCVVEIAPEAAAEFDNTRSPLQENLFQALSEMRHNAPERDRVSNSDVLEFLKGWENRSYKTLLDPNVLAKELKRLVGVCGIKKHVKGQWDISDL